MSPSSLKLTLAQLQRGKSLDLAGCLQMVIFIGVFSCFKAHCVSP
jgi:hypothetical protein